MKDKNYFIIALIIFSIIIFNNSIPQGYILASGDFNQVFNLKDNFMKFFYAWTEHSSNFGSYSPLFPNFFLYLLLLPLDLIFKSPTILMQLTWLIILFGSFLSFFYCLKLLKINSNKNIQFLSSLIYPLNFFIMNILMNPYLNRLHSSLYIFLPILFALTYKILTENKINWRYLSIYGIISFISLFSFSNPAFFILYILIIGILFIFNLMFKKINFKSLIIYLILNFLIFSILIFTTYPNITSGIKIIQDSKVNGADTKSWLSWQSVKNINLFTFSNDPAPSPIIKKISNNSTFLFIFLFSSFLYSLLFLIGLIYKKKNNNQRNLFLLSFLSILFLFLLASKLSPPFSDLKYFLNSNSLIILFRSTEKLLLLVPFFTILGIAIFFDNLNSVKIKYFLIIILLLIPIPLYYGNIFTDMNILLDNNQNYKTSNYSTIVKIPEEYYQLAKTINNQPEEFRILGLPYSIVNSENWMNYIKWKHIGSDPTQEIINKPILNPNQKILNWFPGYDFDNNKSLCDEWLIYYSSISNVKYIIYHKDVPNNFINSTRLNYLENKQYIHKLETNDYFDLYEIDSQYLKTPIFSNINLLIKDNFSINKMPSSFCEDKKFNYIYTNNNLNNINLQNKDIDINYKKINPTKYKIEIKNISGKFPIILSQKYSNLWRIKSNSNIKTTQFIVNGYLNGWIIEPSENQKELSLEIYFKPQSYFYLGLIISITTLILCIIYLIYNWRKHKNKSF